MPRLRYEKTGASGGGGGAVDSVSESGTTPLTISPTTGDVLITIAQANTSTDGYLSQTDWDTFNEKASNSDLITHTNDTTIHFTQANIDHTAIQNIGANTHAQIDTHINDATIHYTQATISIPASQISDFDTEVSNNTTVTSNTNHKNGDGSDHADVATNTTHRGLTNNPHGVTASQIGTVLRLGDSNTYVLVDTVNHSIKFFINGGQVAEWS